MCKYTYTQGVNVLNHSKKPSSVSPKITEFPAKSVWDAYFHINWFFIYLFFFRYCDHGPCWKIHNGKWCAIHVQTIGASDFEGLLLYPQGQVSGIVKLRVFLHGLWCHRSSGPWCGHCCGANVDHNNHLRVIKLYLSGVAIFFEFVFAASSSASAMTFACYVWIIGAKP